MGLCPCLILREMDYAHGAEFTERFASLRNAPFEHVTGTVRRYNRTSVRGEYPRANVAESE